MKNEEVTTNGIITINTIAKMANVSTATVSYVINERTDKKVAEATRQKILDLCRKYNYQKGAARKRPKDKKPVTIDDIAKEAFLPQPFLILSITIKTSKFGKKHEGKSYKSVICGSSSLLRPRGHYVLRTQKPIKTTRSAYVSTARLLHSTIVKNVLI